MNENYLGLLVGGNFKKKFEIDFQEVPHATKTKINGLSGAVYEFISTMHDRELKKFLGR